MSYFVILRERGPAWDWSKPMRQQAGWEAHAAYMDALVDEGFMVLGGPLGGENDAARVLHVIEATDKAAVEARIAIDPWTPHLLNTVSIDPWTVLLGSLRSAGTSGSL